MKREHCEAKISKEVQAMMDNAPVFAITAGGLKNIKVRLLQVARLNKIDGFGGEEENVLNELGGLVSEISELLDDALVDLEEPDDYRMDLAEARDIMADAYSDRDEDG